MADERDEIRSRIDLVELVGQRVALKRAGKHWKGLCPFHADKNPSFYVSPDTGYYRCWSCGEKGDLFDWVMKTQNLEFRDALEQLAKQAGVELKSRPGEASKGESEARAAAMDEALRFFHQELNRGGPAREYCEKRGLSSETLEAWELGYAPDLGEALAIHLNKKGHNLALCRALFLVDQDAGGGYYDRFRGRLMFPIRDERGALVAFGGRLLGDGVPKYVNSGDTPIYRKSRVLYGLHRAKTKLLETRRIVLVEGYLDVIACHTAGVEEAVASLGTSLAEDHGRLIKRWCDRATILYDSDEAGQKAAERACDVLREAGVAAEVALVPPGDDPDTLLRREGSEAVRKAAGGGITPLEFALRRIEKAHNPSGAEFWEHAAEAMANCPSPAELDRHVTELAAKHMKGQTEAGARTTIYGMVKARRRAQLRPGFRAAVALAPAVSDLAAPESAVFRALLDESLRAQAFSALAEDGLLRTGAAIELGVAIRQAFPEKPPKGPVRDWIGAIESPELRAKLADIQFFAGLKISGRLIEDAASEEALAGALETLRRQRNERKLQELRSDKLEDDGLAAIQRHLEEKLKGRHDYDDTHPRPANQR